jgi:glycine/D-amino acid oxidase-like deaminating enzyme
MKNYLIIGGGLAGTTLAWKLQEKNIPFLIVDDPQLSRSTRTAAGLFNPLVFKKLNKVWRADELFPSAIAFWKQTGTQLVKQLLHEMPLLRVFSSEIEFNDWHRLKHDPSFSAYMDNERNTGEEEKYDKGFGTGWVNHCGYLDTNSFLNASHDFFNAQKSYLRKTFAYSDITENADQSWCFENTNYSAVVFCEGWKMQQNPWFGKLPLVPAKGEVLTFEKKDGPTVLVNGGCFVLPVGDGNYRLGSTFAWKDMNDEPTEKAKSELLQKAKELLNFDIEVQQHLAGVRPATQDYRPFLGRHPQHPGLIIFNGLGTRGVVQAPWCADALLHFLEENIPLPVDISINRYIN